MRKLTLSLAILCLTLTSVCLSAPSVTIYRYQGDGFTRDDTKWLAGKKTALLIHGFPMFGQGERRQDMIELAAHLSVSRRVDDIMIPGYDAVYAVEYPSKYHILDTASVLSDIVSLKCSNWPKNTKIDVFAHSMGGLVARTAIEYPEVLLGTKNASNRVRYLVTMGTPHNGVSSPVADIFKEAFGQLPIEVGDMSPKGLFMNMLNFRSSKKPQVSCDYYSIVGARSYRPKVLWSSSIGPLAVIAKKVSDISYPVHDGLISADSAGYDLKEVCHAFKKAQLDLNHEYIRSHPEVFSTIDRWMIDDRWFDMAESKKKPETSAGLGPQILLGKSRDEIEKMFGTTYLMLNTFNYSYYRVDVNRSNGGYTYGSEPAKYYVTNINFFSRGQMDHVTKRLNRVHSVSIMYLYDMYDPQKRFYLRPEQIVPSSILNHKYHSVYRGATTKNTIAVLWFIDNKTYLMVLCDLPSRPLYSTKTVNGVKKYYANQNTYDFRKAYIWYFAYIDAKIKLRTENGVSDRDDISQHIPIDGAMCPFYNIHPFSK